MSKQSLKYIFLWLMLISSIQLSAETIKVGMSAALTGPSAALGNDLRSGIESYFKWVNDNGGVQDKQLEFIIRDDGYEPERAALNMRTLIDDDGVLAVLGNVGTPTAIVTVPIAEQKKTLLFGAFSGGGVLRKTPVSRYVINYRPSYAEETTEMVDGLLKVGIKPQQIAFFTQRDGYGDAAFISATTALTKHGAQDEYKLAHGRYTRNTLNVEDAVATILDAAVTPKVIIMAGGYAPSAKFIKLLKNELPEVWFVNVSFVGSSSLQQALDANTSRVVVTQVVPELESKLPIVSEYHSALKEYDKSIKPNEVSLEGFILAKIFHQGLLQVEGMINKESIINGLESLNGIDIGLGLDIYYDQHEHQAIHNLWLTSLKKGRFKHFNWQQMLKD